jgi:RNA polymerase sigma-70 factor (ECF subfamily)
MRRESDLRLIASARRGSPEAVSALYDRYVREAWRAAYGVCGRRALADEIVQEAFERVIAGLDTFDTQRAFKPWLHRIVMNRAVDVLRRERRYAAAGPDEAMAPEREDASAFLALVLPLDPERRVMVVMRYGLGYTPAQIAELLEVPLGTVHSRLARALEELRAQTEAAVHDA